MKESLFNNDFHENFNMPEAEEMPAVSKDMIAIMMQDIMNREQGKWRRIPLEQTISFWKIL